MLFKTKNSYTYTDNFGKRHKLKISDSEVICAPYDILPTGNMALQTQGICKLMYWEKYQDMKLCNTTAYSTERTDKRQCAACPGKTDATGA